MKYVAFKKSSDKAYVGNTLTELLERIADDCESFEGMEYAEMGLPMTLHLSVQKSQIAELQE